MDNIPDMSLYGELLLDSLTHSVLVLWTANRIGRSTPKNQKKKDLKKFKFRTQIKLIGFIKSEIWQVSLRNHSSNGQHRQKLQNIDNKLLCLPHHQHPRQVTWL